MNNDLLKKIDASVKELPDGYKINTKFTWKKHRTVPTRLAVFCIDNENKPIILSSVMNIIGVDYCLLVKCLWCYERARDVNFQFVYDQEYLQPIGEVKEVIVEDEFLAKVLRKIELGDDYIDIVLDTAKRFSIKDYEKFVIQRERDHSPDGLTSFEYINKMELYPKLKDTLECEITEAAIADSIRERVERNQKNPTNAEIRVKEILDENNIKYEFQYPVMVLGSTYILDFYLPEKNVCIEIDGDYHNEYRQVYVDKQRDIKLSRIGVMVVRFHNCEIWSDVEPLAAFLHSVLGYEIKTPTIGISCMYPEGKEYPRRRD